MMPPGATTTTFITTITGHPMTVRHVWQHEWSVQAPGHSPGR